jgi:hypothetical protein
MISGYQSEAHDKVSGYLGGSASLVDVENWIWSFLGDLESSQDEAVRNAAGSIGRLISEYSHGDISEDSLRRELAAAILPLNSGAKLYSGSRSREPLIYGSFSYPVAVRLEGTL